MITITDFLSIVIIIDITTIEGEVMEETGSEGWEIIIGDTIETEETTKGTGACEKGILREGAWDKPTKVTIENRKTGEAIRAEDITAEKYTEKALEVPIIVKTVEPPGSSPAEIVNRGETLFSEDWKNQPAQGEDILKRAATGLKTGW